MNRYGAMARSHWRQWLPGRYQAIEDPEAFFDQLGRQVETEIETLYQAMLATEPANRHDEHPTAWRTQAHLHAENQILTELVLVDPEHGDTERPADPGSPNASRTAMLNELYDATDPFSPTATDPT